MKTASHLRPADWSCHTTFRLISPLNRDTFDSGWKTVTLIICIFSFEFSRFSQAAIYLEPDRYGISLFVQK